MDGNDSVHIEQEEGSKKVRKKNRLPFSLTLLSHKLRHRIQLAPPFLFTQVVFNQSSRRG